MRTKIVLIGSIWTAGILITSIIINTDEIGEIYAFIFVGWLMIIYVGGNHKTLTKKLYKLIIYILTLIFIIVSVFRLMDILSFQ